MHCNPFPHTFFNQFSGYHLICRWEICNLFSLRLTFNENNKIVHCTYRCCHPIQLSFRFVFRKLWNAILAPKSAVWCSNTVEHDEPDNQNFPIHYYSRFCSMVVFVDVMTGAIVCVLGMCACACVLCILRANGRTFTQPPSKFMPFGIHANQCSNKFVHRYQWILTHAACLSDFSYGTRDTAPDSCIDNVFDTTKSYVPPQLHVYACERPIFYWNTKFSAIHLPFDCIYKYIIHILPATLQGLLPTYIRREGSMDFHKCLI